MLINIQIKKIHALPTGLILYDNDCQVYLKFSDKEMKMIVLGRADLVEIKNNRLALLDKTKNEIIIYDVDKLLRGKIRVKLSLDILCFTEDGQYLFGISHKQSLLLMYAAENGKCLEKIFIENLSVCIQATMDRLILSRNKELLLMSIVGKRTSTLKR